MIGATTRNLILDWLLGAAAVTRPTAWHISLHTGDPGTTGANEVVVGTDADYVRKSATFAAASGGQKSNAGAYTWTADVAATSYNVTHIGVWDSASGGTFLVGGALPVPEPMVASGSLVLAIGRAVAALT